MDWFGHISFVTNSIAVVLQLALAIDYAIILCHRFQEERAQKPAREAAIAALSKAIPEISASSLTTVAGLLALTFMQFRLGYDMGTVLIKAILFSLLSVFLLMPGLLMLFSPLIDKTHHKSFVPKISFLGRLDYRTRFVVPPLFLIAFVLAFFCSNKANYVYSQYSVGTIRHNETQIAKEKIHGLFGSENLMAVLVPAGDYDKEAALLKDMAGLDGVSSTLGLAGVTAMDDYTVTSSLTPRQFAELADLDYEAAKLLYAAYAADRTDYGRIVGDLDGYSVPLIDMFLYLYQEKEAGYVTLDSGTNATIDDLYARLTDARRQLRSDDWSRLLVYFDLPTEGEESFAALAALHDTVSRYYEEAYIVGDTTSCYDLRASFENDNLMISIFSVLFVMAVLLLTFRSAGLPVLLILVIQGSIFLNFSRPYLEGQNLFFLTYLIISAIQMGANIDYAIVISSRYMELKKTMPIREAMVETLNLAFPTIITSGAMLASAGIVIGFMTSNETIFGHRHLPRQRHADLHFPGHVRAAPDPAAGRHPDREDDLHHQNEPGRPHRERPPAHPRPGPRRPERLPRRRGGRRVPRDPERHGGRGDRGAEPGSPVSQAQRTRQTHPKRPERRTRHEKETAIPAAGPGADAQPRRRGGAGGGRGRGHHLYFVGRGPPRLGGALPPGHLVPGEDRGAHLRPGPRHGGVYAHPNLRRRVPWQRPHHPRSEPLGGPVPCGLLPLCAGGRAGGGPPPRRLRMPGGRAGRRGRPLRRQLRGAARVQASRAPSAAPPTWAA